MNIKVYYPSGHTLKLSGEFLGSLPLDDYLVQAVILDKDCPIPGHLLRKGEAMIGDPRGVYVNMDTKKIIYDPRMSGHIQQQWVLDWLKEHPEWPGLLELDGAC